MICLHIYCLYADEKGQFMAISVKFGKNFRALVAEIKGKTRQEIAREMRVSYTTFSNMYNYGILPRVSVLMRAADLFDVSVDYLLGMSEKRHYDKADPPGNFHDRLTLLRTENGMTVYRLAEKLHVHRNSVAEWYAKKCIPVIDTVAVAADHFGVSIDYVLGRTNDRTGR